MTTFEMPANLRGPDPSWLSTLPGRVADLAERWELTVGRPFQPGGTASWVAPVVDAAGARMVLKVGWMHYEARDEAEGLRVWDGRGTVRVHRSEQDGETSALLLEACEPGTMLSAARPPEERDEVLAAILPRLWIEPPPGHPFRPLQSMVDAWASEYEPDGAPDPGLVRAGLELWRELPATATRHVLLCTDLHPDNILQAQREPWLIIDPKPYVGDPHYEPIQHMLNFPDRLAAGPGVFADRMAGLLELDRARVRQWLFARCVLESLWDLAGQLRLGS